MAYIQLIKTPVQGKMIIEDKWYLPLELIWLGTYVRQFGHEVEILDGQLLSKDQIKRRINAPIVGINFNFFSAVTLDDLVQAAKDRGAIVVVGGQAATHLCIQLIERNANIDAVIRFDGEEALRQIADAYDSGRDPYTNTPNIVYRHNGQIITNRIEEVPVDIVPIPDRRLQGIDIEKYFENYHLTNTFLGFNGNRVTNAHTKKGCPRNCSFCGRIDKVFRPRTPRQTFNEYRNLIEEFNVDYIFDHSDTWACDKLWLEEFHHVYQDEGGLDVRLAVFCDLRDLTSSTIEILKTVGVDTVEVGVESGNESILRNNQKYFKRTDIIDRLTRLAEVGIKVEASYVLGCIGESRESVRDTLDLSRILRDHSQQIRNYFNIILPLPGSLNWQLLMQDSDMKNKYGNDFIFDIDELRNDYLTRFCNLGSNPYEFLTEERNNILTENGLCVMEYAR